MTTSDVLDTDKCLPGVKTLLVKLAALGKALMVLHLESRAHLYRTTVPTPTKEHSGNRGVGLHRGKTISTTVDPLHILNEPSFPIRLLPAWLSGVTSR